MEGVEARFCGVRQLGMNCDLLHVCLSLITAVLLDQISKIGFGFKMSGRSEITYILGHYS
jgi:hypothetical protein